MTGRDRHEIVNDRVGELPVVVTFCPVCNTAVSFDPRVDGQELRFGVSGLLRNSDLVMWDDATTSLWQQITGEAVVGEFAGTRLDLIPTSIAAYGDVLENFPEAVAVVAIVVPIDRACERLGRRVEPLRRAVEGEAFGLRCAAAGG